MRRASQHVGRPHQALAAPLTQHQKREVGLPFYGMNRWALNGYGQPIVNKEDMENMKFDTKSRAQWDYQGINERITAQSAFTDSSQRKEFFTGPRPDHRTTFAGSFKTPPEFSRLYEYFDEYTKPGSNKKLQAAFAVREHWDADNWYYPGESWKRNRPSFRGVPPELLNTQTWYHWTDMIANADKIWPTLRPRNWNPNWPPPGYRVPKLWTKREFSFGVEEPGLMTEVERWGWYKNWMEMNQRIGPYEVWLWVLAIWIMYKIARGMGSPMRMRLMFANLWYPGRQLIRQFGEPRDWRTDNWWWQEPLETWPNQGEVWFFSEQRFKYMNHCKRKEEALKLKEAEAATA